MVNRKQKYFRLAELSYAEIANPQTALDELLASGLSVRLDSTSSVDLMALLSIFAKHELESLCQSFKLPLAKTKTAMILGLCQTVVEVELLNHISRQTVIFMPTYQTELQMLRFLFFGSLKQDMTRFVMRDLGHLKPQPSVQEDFTPYFNSRQEAEDCLAVQLAYQEFKQISLVQEPRWVYQWFLDWCADHGSLAEQAQARLSKLILKLAKLLEKHGLLVQALEIYRLTEHPPSYERQIRLLSKLGNKKAALELCQKVLGQASSAKEQFFAYDYIEKNQSNHRRKSTTLYLYSSEIIALPEERCTRPEQAIINWLNSQGWEALYTENYVWRGLFGLVFWNIVFDSKFMHQPLQTAPSDLYSPNFFVQRQDQFKAELAQLFTQANSLDELRQRYQRWYGLTNPMLSWHDSLWESIERCCFYLTVEQIAEVLLEMARDWRHNSCGFPDLLSWQSESYSFIEVKSPNDHLSEQQLKWLMFFQRLKIKACVKRIQW